jgi:hypothetical protein
MYSSTRIEYIIGGRTATKWYLSMTYRILRHAVEFPHKVNRPTPFLPSHLQIVAYFTFKCDKIDQPEVHS